MSGHFFANCMFFFSQNWGSDGHYEVLNRAKPWLIQKLLLKMQIFQFPFFCDSVEINAFVFFRFLSFFAFCVITAVPIMIQFCSASQNDRLNLSFVKDFYIVGTKMARNGCEMAIYQIQILMINLWFSQDLAQPQGKFRVIPFKPIKILTH